MDLADKIRKIEALIAGASEKEAAELAKQEKFSAETVEYVLNTNSYWKKKLFMAICQKYGLSTYRYKGQKYTTARVCINKDFMEQVLWPEYHLFAKKFDELASEIMENLIAKIHKVEDDDIIVSDELPFV